MKNHTDKPILIILCGLPGSGKSYFADYVSKLLPAVWLSGDGLRGVLFKDRHKIKHEQPEQYYQQIFKALDYSVTQALKAGINVIYETQGNTESARKHMWDLSIVNEAIPILVLIQTDEEIAKTRASSRTDKGHHIWVDPAKYSSIIAKFEPILFTDDYLIIDGSVDSTMQLAELSAYIEKRKMSCQNA